MRLFFFLYLCFCFTRSQAQNPFFKVAIKFPDDIFQNNCGNFDYGAPVLYNPDSLPLVVTYYNEIVEFVPEVCYLLQRDWLVYNADFYDPQQATTLVPNPNPSPIPNNGQNRPGPIISMPGTPAPWAPTSVKISPADPLPTDYAVFYTGGAYKTTINGVLTTVTVPAVGNGLHYQQIIKVLSTQPPQYQACPLSTFVINDSTQNNPELWNAPYWFNPAGGTDLDESAIDLSVNVTDSCGLDARYLLFLDLDGDGSAETVINSSNRPPAGYVYFGNASTPNYQGGELRRFDQRVVSDNNLYWFGVKRTLPYNPAHATFSLVWNTQIEPSLEKMPELPTGSHSIKWFVEDPCGNEASCVQNFNITNQTTATGQAIEGTGFQIFANQPNPFIQTTLLRFQLPESAPATLEIRDQLGRMIFTATERYAAGANSVRLGDAELGAAKGPLFCALRTETRYAVIRLLRL